MFFSYEEMFKKFGIKYEVKKYGDYTISEVFASIGDKEDVYDTPDEARKFLLAFIENQYEFSKSRLEDKKVIYEKKLFAPGILNILGTISGNKQKKLKQLQDDFEKIEEDRVKAISMVEINEVKELNKNNVYEVKYPDLKKGDKIYLSLHKPNQIERGVYEVLVDKVLRHEGYFQFDGTVFKDGKVESLINGFNDEEGLRNSFSYNRFFLTEDEAKSYYNSEIDKEVNELLSFKIS